MTAETPNFGLLLAPILSQVDAASRPRFLALLERTAADRYRKWAANLPDHAAVLLECAGREDEIADRIGAAFSVDAAKLEELQRLLPAARDIYYAAFDGMDVREQIRVQSDAELQGAHAWRSIAAGVTDTKVLAELARCSELEELSSAAVKAFLAS
jgi:hypothetical protein